MQSSNRRRIAAAQASGDAGEQVLPLNSALQEAYDQLALSEKRYRELYNNAPDMYHTLDLEGNLVEFNPKHTEILGYSREELEGRHISFILTPEMRNHLANSFVALMKEGTLEGWEFDLKKKDGGVMPVELHAMLFTDTDGNPKEIRGIMRDLTERRRLTEHLQQVQKIECVGQLAGGIAHDFNNLLTAIIGYTQMSLQVIPDWHEARDYMQQSLDAAQRAAALTRQLLAFSRRQIFNPQVSTLNDLISNMEKMLRRLIGEDIDLAIDLSPDAGLVKVDSVQLEQVLLNLSINARDAMPRGGRLTIKTANQLLEPHQAHRLGIPAGEHVTLEVRDTGVGMPDEVKARLFEPFFTTKPEGKGTGLGLSMCYGIIKQSRGHIEVHSQVGRGSAFKIYLPRVSDAEAQAAGPPEADNEPARPFAATILLVEDDELVRRLAGQVLRVHGYRVLEASNGVEALKVAEAHSHEDIDLLFTDVVMPQMGGKELAELLKATRPDMDVLFTSGYTEDAIVRQGIQEASVSFLHKPYPPAALVDKVRRVLEKTS